MINIILIALIAWPIIGILLLYATSMFYTTRFAMSQGVTRINDFIDTYDKFSEKNKNKPIKLIDNSVVKYSVTYTGKPSDSVDKWNTRFMNVMLWPQSIIIMRRELKAVLKEFETQ